MISSPNIQRPACGQGRREALSRPTRLVAAAAALLLPMALGFPAVTANAKTAPVGQGFTVTPSDLAYILKQIKIAERHARATQGTEPTAVPNPSPVTDPNYCQSMVGSGPDQIPDVLTPYGLRTVDGSCNNLIAGRGKWASADQKFPRYTSPVFKDAESITGSLPVGPLGPTSYAQKKGSVVDSQPRMISNLISDQTSTNPAAVAAARFPIRTQRGLGLVPCTTDPDATAVPAVVGVPTNCVPTYQTLPIPNVTTDVGLSPPFNSMFTFFGQFFDHGIDQTVKSGGTVFVPLRADDPLIAGPDHIFGNGDDLAPNLRFMVLTRAQNQPGPDGILGDRAPTTTPITPCTTLNTPVGCDESADDIQDATNTDSPWVDQSQTYASHPSHQVFLRQYVLNNGADGIAGNADDKPVSTGELMAGTGGGAGMATWKTTKAQAANLLGIQLVDMDALNVPMIATDPYGKFIPGPARGLPQFVTATGLSEANRADNGGLGTRVPADVRYFDTPFLTDIAHNADPSPQDLDHNPATPNTNPTPDLDLTASADFANQPVGTYDDEMLDAHFVAGDGRVNENIALTAIHQVLHSEHDRLVNDIKNVLDADALANPTTGVAALAEWKSVLGAPSGVAGVASWNGERLFQAARFVTEMEYQHIVFDEFARKIQPGITVFKAYNPEINPAVHAEFAHAVYRFGHSMLDETVARTEIVPTSDPKVDKTVDHSIPLLTAFLNPPEYFKSATPGVDLPAEVAAGGIIMGASNQVGNEIDEFVTETLRNNLLGLPLDLAALNMTRAREAGVPSLNRFRRQTFVASTDLPAYTSWADFLQHIKHPESLINFVAAYGKHPSIRDSGPDGIAGNADDVTTVAAKRTAARAIVDPRPADLTATPPIPADVPPTDAADFMLSTGTWASKAGGVTTTGLGDVDLWVGGLAEKTSVNGGLLGSTFNYVWQNQLSDLQDGDRLYYIPRMAGLNLTSQIDGNSFAELIQRNTAGSTDSLKADVFATADCKFQLANLAGSVAGFDAQKAASGDGSTVADDPTTQCNETKLLIRHPDGTIEYRLNNTVDPVGINGQSVYTGTNGADLVAGGSDNDTFWGAKGNDVIEGGAGNDVALGGDGNDIINDDSGDDTLKGGPGNDAISGGPGLDFLFGGDGQDFINGGAGDNLSFGGPGNDFVIGGQGSDNVLGDGGNDWIQGGTGADSLSGDHGAPFLDDPGQTQPGNDILIGEGGGDVYSAEGGDDVMTHNTGTVTFTGSAGFDWAIHQYDTVAADDDMKINNNLFGLVHPVPNRDVWQETEAESGSAFNDIIRGDDATPSANGGAGLTGCDVLDQAGVDRISGLAQLLPQTLTGDPAPVIAKSMRKTCPISGKVWGEGNILLGGAGSDTIEGRGGNDIIDGDKSLTVRISVRTNPLDPTTEIGSTDLMEHTYKVGDPRTLQADVFAGLVDPGNLVAVREIIAPPATAAAGDVDTAVFSDVAANYTVTTTGGTGVLGSPGSTTTVVHKNGGANGTDTLRNIENLQFAPAPPPTTPSASFTASRTTGDAPLLVTMTDTSTNTPTSWAWTFGNGTSSTVKNPSMTYNTAGTFTVTLIATNATGSSTPVTQVITVTAAPVDPPHVAPDTRISDFNRDGITDMLARDKAGVLWLYPGNGIAGFKGRTSMGAGWNTFTAFITPGDVNGDGNGDVMAKNAAGQLFLYPGNGTGGFKGRTSLGLGWNNMTAISAAGDLNGDGFGDVLAKNAAGQLWLYPSTGTGLFRARILAGAKGWNAMTALTGAGDLSGDGRADLLARDIGGNLWVYQGNGAGGFSGTRIWAGDGWNAMTILVAPGNFDRARGNDLITRDRAGMLWLYPGDNAGHFSGRRALGAGFSGYAIA